MPNYFYTDKNGTKRGPISDQQLRVFISQKIITPETPLETESGHKGLAGQIPGLNFPSSSPSSQTAQAAMKTAQSAMNATVSIVRQASERKGMLAWLLDFAFRNIKFPVINLWFCRIVYAIYFVAAILGLIGGTLAILYFTFEAVVRYGGASYSFGILFIPLFWIVIAIAIIAVRLCLEWEVMVVDWIILTTQAARRFLDDEKT
ncbi:hypothetical protein FACS1894170_09880 [Planctomycetales bacterium]|nr:hypothetical protein FACS1894170_09880 [Planctomycetales bacterium]